MRPVAIGLVLAVAVGRLLLTSVPRRGLVGQRMHDNYAEVIEDSSVCRLDMRNAERLSPSDARIARTIMALAENPSWPNSLRESRRTG